MTKRPPPRTTMIDGQEMIVLDPAEYDGLQQLRRQVGSLSTRVNILKQQLHAAAAVIADVEAILAAHACDDHGSDCPCHEIIRRITV